MCDTKRRSLLRSSAGLLGGRLRAGNHRIGLEGRPMHPPDRLHGGVQATDVMAATARQLPAALRRSNWR
jgi:hypothetical protein